MKSILSLLLMLTLFGVAAAQSVDTSSITGPLYTIAVYQGDRVFKSITVELFPDVAPRHVRNFDSLVSIQFYDGTAFHRVIPDTLIQGGDPNSRDLSEDTWGYGDPDQATVPAEFSSLKHLPGILSAARRLDDTNSATSQFFILAVARPDLDGRFSIYGHVVEGMETVDTLTNLPRQEGTSLPVEKVEMKVTKGVSAVRAARSAAGTELRASAFPNPCNMGSAIEYVTAVAARTVVTVFDAMGRAVAVPVDRFEEAGEHTAIFDAENLPAGSYTYLLRSGSHAVTGRVMVIR